MAFVDLILSTYAVHNGYYENNPFSNKFGLLTHFILLGIIATVLVYFGFWYFLALLAIIWFINNVVSIRILL